MPPLLVRLSVSDLPPPSFMAELIMGHYGIMIINNQKKIDFKQMIIDFREKNDFKIPSYVTVNYHNLG